MGRPKGSKNKPKPALTPQEEEAQAERKRKALEKARKVRSENAHRRNSILIWQHIQPRIKSSNCRCGLKKGMTLEDLGKLGTGCGSEYDYITKVLKQTPPWQGMTYAEATQAGVMPRPGGVCSTLDAYRRYLERPQTLTETEAA